MQPGAVLGPRYAVPMVHAVAMTATIRRAGIVCLFGAAALPAQDRPAAALPARLEAVRDAVRSEVLPAAATPALSLAVVLDGALVWAEGFGTADREAARAATADTIYRLASISKPITATALMRFVERGLLGLDDPVNGHLDAPGLRAMCGEADGITLRRLLNHTAGLPTHWHFFHGTPPPPRAETIAAYGFAVFAPGERTNYSNLAFGVLDHVLARTARADFRTVLRQEVFEPLGMQHSDLGVRPGREALAAAGYTKTGGGFERVRDYGFDHDGASAVWSSAPDLMRFAMLQLGLGTVDGVAVLQSDSVLAMRQCTGRRAGSRYGIAWDVAEERGALVLRHSGSMPGVSTALQILPAQRAAFAVLTNGSDRTATQRTVALLLDAILGAGPGTAGRARAGAAAAARAPAALPPPGRFAGRVAHPGGAIALEVEVADAGATSLRLGAGALVAAQQSVLRDGRWSVRWSDALPLPQQDPRQPALELELEPMGQGHAGVLYATLEGVCRLPHQVVLEPVPR